ncbi:unnamed protein product [Alopecurus aequalis]
MAAGDDRLSGLSDDLLRRVLHFVPAREGAFSSVQSRRWRPLWRSCGAVNLEARVDRKDGEAHDRFNARRDAVVSAVHKALDAAEAAAEADGAGPIRKLTIRLEARSKDKIREFLYPKNQNVFAIALSHPAARRVEELRIAAVDSVGGKPMYFETSKYEADPYFSEIYPLRLDSLPSPETLRVLELTNCGSVKTAFLQTAAGAFFPRLVSLRLRHCSVRLDKVQDIIYASPLLAVIHLDSLPLEDEGRYQPRSRSLCCPAATELVLDKCCFEEGSAMEIFAPMLRRFRYRGVVRRISLSPPSAHLARAELTLVEHGEVGERDLDVARRSFWGTMHGFSQAREMKLRVRHLEEIAITDETGQAELLPKFRNLHRLELQGVHTPTGKAAAAAIANVLRCCPALCDLRINLSSSHEDTTKQYEYGFFFLERKYRSEFEESVQRFKRRRRSQPTVARDDDEDDDANYDEVSDLPRLSGQSFKCLRRCLRRVGLQFQRKDANCFGIRLIKFFAEHAKVLEEMCIDAGNERISEHMNPKVEKWIANKSKRRRINSTSETKVKVLSLTRSN